MLIEKDFPHHFPLLLEEKKVGDDVKIIFSARAGCGNKYLRVYFPF
jgi:hypothetical protein